MKKNQLMEKVIHGIFLLLGLITVGCVLLITIYLVISGIPAIREIGLLDFLFGKEWASTASEPKYGILPFTPWRRKWQPTPVFLPGESHGQRSLVGYSPRGHKESGTTEQLHFHFCGNREKENMGLR